MNKLKKKIKEKDYKDLIELLSTLLKSKSEITKITLIFFIFSLIYSISIKNVYTASSTFYPHYEKNSISQSSGLRSLAGLAGIDLGSETSQNIPPTLYPNIISSPIFKIEILNSKISLNNNELTYRDYLLSLKDHFNIKKIILFPISAFSKLLKNEKKSEIQNYEILELSEEEYNLHDCLSDKILLKLNDKEGFIELSVKDNNPMIASQIAKIANNLLQKNIIEFKLKNLNDTYKFVNSQLEIAKKNFYKLQDSLAVFNDRNLNIKTDIYLNQSARIESEYLISKNIYNELALNKEKTAIEVKKNTPIFTIIKPVVMPNEKSEPKRAIIIIVFTFIGLIISCLYVLLKSSLIEIWIELKK